MREPISTFTNSFSNCDVLVGKRPITTLKNSSYLKILRSHSKIAFWTLCPVETVGIKQTTNTETIKFDITLFDYEPELGI